MRPLRLSGSVYRYQFGHRDAIVKLLRWGYKQAKRAERRRVYERLALEARANVDEERSTPERWRSGACQGPLCA